MTLALAVRRDYRRKRFRQRFNSTTRYVIAPGHQIEKQREKERERGEGLGEVCVLLDRHYLRLLPLAPR